MFQYKQVLHLLIWLGTIWLLSYLLNIFPPYDPIQINLSEKLLPPSLNHLCGTDELGRDLYSRMAVGLFNTVSVAFIAFLSSFAIGVVAGAIAGFYYKTWVDKCFNWVCAVLYSVPFLLVISGVMSLVEKNLTNAYLVLTAIIWVAPARIIRAGIIRARSESFVMSERAMGYSEPSILIRTLLPYSIGPSFIFSFRYLPELIGLEAGLSFLGLGIQPPEPGLGKMIYDSLTFVYSAWWYALFPALLLFVVVLVLNLSLKISSTSDVSS